MRASNSLLLYSVNRTRTKLLLISNNTISTRSSYSFANLVNLSFTFKVQIVSHYKKRDMSGEEMRKVCFDINQGKKQ